MSKTISNPLRLTAPRSHSLRDLAVVLFLAVILGAFVAQIASAPPAADSAPSASVAGVTLGSPA